MRSVILGLLAGSALLFGQAVTTSTEHVQRSDTTMTLDGDRSKVTTNSSSTTRTADSNGNSTVDSKQKSTVSKEKHGKKIQSTTTHRANSTVTP